MEQEGEKSVHTVKESLGNRWKWKGKNFFTYLQISNGSEIFFFFFFHLRLRQWKGGYNEIKEDIETEV